jgi:AcrR family transcriptional regulator
MHSVTESAISLREWKKVETAHRITLAAQRLTDAHGLDGFTVDELAEAAEVSRRTLFNYFPSKVDAVLGAHPELPEEDLATFRAGGPHGDVVDDVAELARIALAVKQPDQESLELGLRVLRGEPRLLAAAHERFESVTDEFAALLVEREGPDFAADKARLLLRLLLTLLDSALNVLVAEGPGRTLVEVFDEQLALARELFA